MLAVNANLLITNRLIIAANSNLLTAKRLIIVVKSNLLATKWLIIVVSANLLTAKRLIIVINANLLATKRLIIVTNTNLITTNRLIIKVFRILLNVAIKSFLFPKKKEVNKNGRNVSVSIAANYFATLRPISFVRMHNIQPFLTEINGLIQFF